MRLQLTVQRHGLPPVHVLWTVGGFRPGYTTDEASTTVSQLLEQINEIIPLEAEEWGLEDYVVEVRGFECLHFSGLDKILKEDDEVSIRPLQTSDLRYRKMSGRHQISTDGRHLIDGVSFGRPFLRRGDRPSVRIPPRKRIRLMNDDEDEEVEAHTRVPETSRQIFTRASPVLGELDENSEDDEEFAPNTEYDENLDAELDDLRNEAASGVNEDGLQLLEGAERTVHLDGTVPISGRLTRSRRRKKQQGLGLQGEDILELVDENGRQYPGEYHNPLLEQYYQDLPESQVETTSKHSQVQKSRPRGVRSTRRLQIPEQTSRRSSSASMKSVRFQDDEIKTPATVLEADDTEASDDENFELNEAVESTSSESNKENVKPGDQAGDSSNTSSDPQQSSSIVTSTSESGGSETSSSLASSSTSSSDSESPESSAISVRDLRLNTEDAGQTPGAISAFKSTPSNAQHSPAHIPPGLGRRDTQKRNQRRRESKRLRHLKRIGILPSNATKSDLLKQEARSKLSSPDIPEVLPSNHTRLSSVISDRRPDWGERVASKTLEAPSGEGLSNNAEFEARRQSLLDSIASGGVEVEPSTEVDRANMIADSHDCKFLEVAKPDAELSTEPGAERSFTSIAAAPVDQRDVTQASNISTIENGQPKAVTSSYPSQVTATGSQPPRRRAKLDIASSRRLLFGSLGLRTPKSKDDEDKMREKLKENIRPVLQSLNNSTESSAANLNSDTADGDDTWKGKIILKAVECCDDGVELSTPPFPFVQRWDPQQRSRLNSTNGGYGMSRGKKRKRNKAWTHDIDTAYYEDYEVPIEQQEQEFGNGKIDSKDNDQDHEQGIRQTPSDEYQGAVEEQLMRDAHGLSAVPVNESVPVNSLSSIPADPSSCVTLLKDLAVPGAVIAFKQLEMSQETSWQPQVSAYRTAVIDRVLKDQRLEMTLAQQDRPDTKARLYDENTGKRLYSKFEVPDNESEEIQDEDGFIELSFDEMIEPKLIRPADYAHEQPSRQDFQPLIEAADLSNMIDADEESQSPIGNGRGENAEAQENLVMDDGGNLLFQEIDKIFTDQVSQRGGYVEVTEETRKEISILIKDAGFRSDVHSDIDRELENHGSADTSNKQPAGDDSYPALSPRFHGFSSSPPAEEGSHPTRNALGTTHETPSILEQDDFELPGISSPIQLQSGQQVEASLVSGEEMSTSLLYEDNEIRSSYLSEGPKKFNFDQTTLPERLFSHPSPPLINSGVAGKVGKTPPARVPTRIGGLDGADSDFIDELPTTENLSSTVRSHIEVTLSDDDDDDDFPIISSQRTRVKKSKLSGSQSKSQLQSKSQSQSQRTKRSFSIADVLASSNDGDSDFETMSTPRASQIPVGSQIVDLTVSSDAVDPEDSEYEDRGAAKGLPMGPGWVEKTRNGRRIEAAGVRKGQKGGGRKTRSM